MLLVSDQRLIRMATTIVDSASDELLWPHGPHQFRQAFARFLERLQFAEGSYTPYSLRRGGAGIFKVPCLLMLQSLEAGGVAPEQPGNTSMRALRNWLRWLGLLAKGRRCDVGVAISSKCGFASKQQLEV